MKRADRLPTRPPPYVPKKTYLQRRSVRKIEQLAAPRPKPKTMSVPPEHGSKAPLTARQRMVLDWVIAYFMREGVMPVYREISAAFHWRSFAGASTYIKAFVEGGYLLLYGDKYNRKAKLNSAKTDLRLPADKAMEKIREALRGTGGGMTCIEGTIDEIVKAYYLERHNEEEKDLGLRRNSGKGHGDDQERA